MVAEKKKNVYISVIYKATGFSGSNVMILIYIVFYFFILFILLIFFHCNWQVWLLLVSDGDVPLTHRHRCNESWVCQRLSHDSQARFGKKSRWFCSGNLEVKLNMNISKKFFSFPFIWTSIKDHLLSSLSSFLFTSDVHIEE